MFDGFTITVVNLLSFVGLVMGFVILLRRGDMFKEIKFTLSKIFSFVGLVMGFVIARDIGDGMLFVNIFLIASVIFTGKNLFPNGINLIKKANDTTS